MSTAFGVGIGVGVGVGVERDQCGGVGPTLINGDLRGAAMLADDFLQKPQRGLLVTVCGQQKINRLPGLVDRPIEVVPLPFDLDIGLVHPPT